MSSSKNLEFEKTSFLSKSNSAFIEQMYLKFINKDKGEDTDEWALTNGYVSVVPVQFDLTAHHAIKDINTWDL